MAHRKGRDDLNCQHGEHYRACRVCHPMEPVTSFAGKPSEPRSREWIAAYVRELPALPR